MWHVPANLFQLVSMLAPILLPSFMVLLSIFDQNMRGLVYVSGVLIATGVTEFIRNAIQHESSADASPLCSLSGAPAPYNVPVSSSVVISFTLLYLLLPMKAYGTMNYPLVVTVLALFAIDAYTKVALRCTNWLGPTVGSVVGGLLGTVWYALFRAAGYPSLLYFSDYSSNRVFCKKPAKQSFKCRVYKNGELIGHT